MSVPDNEMSEEYVRKLNPQELCQWLAEHGGLRPERQDVVLPAIVGNDIEGADFLEYTHDKWVRHPYNLLGGVANSLVRIANEVKKSGTKEDQLNDDALVTLADARELLSKLISDLTRVVGERDILPGDAFKEAFYNAACACDGFLEIYREELTADEIEITLELMVLYDRMVVNYEFCLGKDFAEETKRASEMLVDACLGFLCIDFILMRFSKFFRKDSHLYHNKNTEWIPPHFFEKEVRSAVEGKVYHKWKPKCDASLCFRRKDDEKYFECLLVFAEHSRTTGNKDSKKITDLLTASAQTIQLLVRGKKLKNPFYLFCYSFQGLKLHLHVMEVKIDTATFFGNVEVFDCSKREECQQAIECSWKIAKYASTLASEIFELSKEFTPPWGFQYKMDERLFRESHNSSKSNAPSSSHHSASGASKPPLAGGSKGKKGRVETGGAEHVARLEEATDLLLKTGEFFDVEPMFETGVVYSSHIEMNPRVDRILTATFGENREAVVVKKVSPSEFNYVKKLKENVHSLMKSPESIGFLFPQSFKDYGGSMKFLVFKKIRPLSNRYFDDLGMVETIYNQLFKFLRFCQAHQIVHGDLKLSNLGLDKENRLCVFDWEECVDGTEGYMAPEVALRSTKPNALSDMFSAGILLQEIVDKLGCSEEIDQDRLQRLRLAISSMLAQEPEKRELVDLDSIKLTRSVTWSASEESGSSGSVVLEERPRMEDMSHVTGDGYNMIST